MLNRELRQARPGVTPPVLGAMPSWARVLISRANQNRLTPDPGFAEGTLRRKRLGVQRGGHGHRAGQEAIQPQASTASSQRVGSALGWDAGTVADRRRDRL